MSTNYVFDGTGETPWTRRTSRGRAASTALSKLAGEHAALAYAPDVLVVRTGGLYGEHGSASKGGNFVVRMIGRARDTGALRMVADQRLTPTATGDLAAALVQASSAASAGCCTSRTPARARGTSSPRRSWRRPGSTCRSSRSRPRAPAAPTGRSTACSRVPGPRPPGSRRCRTGATRCALPRADGAGGRGVEDGRRRLGGRLRRPRRGPRGSRRAVPAPSRRPRAAS